MRPPLLAVAALAVLLAGCSSSAPKTVQPAPGGVPVSVFIATVRTVLPSVDTDANLIKGGLRNCARLRAGTLTSPAKFTGRMSRQSTIVMNAAMATFCPEQR